MMVAVSAGIIGCSKKKEDEATKVNLGLTAVKPIVTDSAPSAFGSATAASLNPYAGSCPTDNPVNLAEEVLACLSEQVLPVALVGENVSLGQWYLHWVNNLDTNIQALNTRFETKPTCMDSSIVDVEFDLDRLTGDAGLLPIVTMKLQCRESFSSTDTTQTQDGAFGIVDSKIYYVTRSSTANGNQRSYILTLAQANLDGTDARIWVVLSSGNSGVAGDEDVSVMRISATPGTNSFAVERVSTNGNNNRITNFIAISDGTALKLDADNTAQGGSLDTCVSASNISEASTGCGAMTSFPVGSGTNVMSLGDSAFFNVSTLSTALATNFDSTSTTSIEASASAAFVAASVLSGVSELVPTTGQ